MPQTWPLDRTERLRPEWELLLCCARQSLDCSTVTRAKALVSQELDWDFLLSQAESHGVRPLLSRHLTEAFTEHLASDLVQKLHRQFQSHARRNLSWLGELLDLVHVCEARGLQVLPYKGPLLALQAYGNVSLRQFCDLDLLIPRLHIVELQDLLLERGYRPALSDVPQRVEHTSGTELLFIRDSDGIQVDLHWAFAPSFVAFGLDARVLSHCRKLPVGHRSVAMLPPEEHLLVVCMHGTKHCWCRLGWVVDIAEIVRRHPELNWRYLLKLASDAHSERALFLGLRLAESLSALDLPEGLSTQIQTKETVKRLASAVEKRLLEDGGVPRVPSFHWFNLKAKDRWNDKLFYLAHLVFAAHDHEKTLLALPSLLSWAYWLVRPLRLLCLYLVLPTWSLLYKQFRVLTSHLHTGHESINPP
jgi:hypothetical protein